MRQCPERCDRYGDRAGRAHGIAAQERAPIGIGIAPKAAREDVQPFLARRVRQGEREEKAGRLGAFGGEIGEVHAQGLLGNHVRGIIGEEMHPADDRVGFEHNVVSRRRHERGGIVEQSECARMSGERTEISRDQPILI